MTPDTMDAIQQRRRLAQALMSEGTSAAPVQHWTQAAARVAQALSGSANMGYADSASKQREAFDTQQAEAKQGAARAYAEGAMQRQVQQKMQLAQQAGLQPGTPQFQEYVYGIKAPDPNADLERQYKLAQIEALRNKGDGSDRIPMGFRPKQNGDGLEPIPGGPADIKRQAAEMADRQRVDSITTTMGRLEDAATNLLQHPGLPRIAGGVYDTYMPNMPGGDAANAAADLETLKAQIARNVIQEMRDAAKTGGAVGQVTEREWPLLMNMIASLDTAQSDEQLAQRIKQVADYAKGLRMRLRGLSGGGEAAPAAGGNPTHVWDPTTGTLKPFQGM